MQIEELFSYYYLNWEHFSYLFFLHSLFVLAQMDGNTKPVNSFLYGINLTVFLEVAIYVLIFRHFPCMF